MNEHHCEHCGEELEKRLCDIVIPVGRAELQLPADKWTTVLLVLLLSLTIVACFHIVFIAAQSENIQGVGSLFGKPRSIEHTISYGDTEDVDLSYPGEESYPELDKTMAVDVP